MSGVGRIDNSQEEAEYQVSVTSKRSNKVGPGLEPGSAGNNTIIRTSSDNHYTNQPDVAVGRNVIYTALSSSVH